jgi:hypothetical protein
MGNKVWVIAYINRDSIAIAQEEINYYGYDDIEIYIPTVRLLKKKSKGKNIFEFVPLLFNYGFFKIPIEKARNPEYLMTLRTQITCLYAWVKDPAKTISNIKLKSDNSNIDDALPSYATASDKEVARMIEASSMMSIYNEDDLNRIKPGDIIKLEGYPFDDMPAEVIKINTKKKEVLVKLDMDAIVKEVTVSFENVFYSVYKNFKEESREESSDEMMEKYGSTTIDYIYFKNNYTEEEYGED